MCAARSYSPVEQIGASAAGGRDAGRPKNGLGERGRLQLVEVLDAEALAVAGEDESLLVGSQAVALAAPAEMFQALLRHAMTLVSRRRHRRLAHHVIGVKPFLTERGFYLGTRSANAGCYRVYVAELAAGFPQKAAGQQRMSVPIRHERLRTT